MTHQGHIPVPVLADALASRPQDAAVSPLRLRLRDLVADILATRLAPAPVPPFDDDDTLAEIGITSMDMVSLLLAVENSFDLEVPQREMTPDSFRSIASIDAMLQRLLRPA